MIFSKLFKKNKKVEKTGENIAPPKSFYDQEFKVKKLKLLIVIVNRYQGDFYVKRFQENGVACSFLLEGNGTGTRDIYDLIGVADTKKDIVFSLVKDDEIGKLKEIIKKRFASSLNAKGVSFAVEMDSVAGVLAYKYLANIRENERRDDYVRPRENSGNDDQKRRKTL